jgi:hypothetical protein
LHDRGQRQVSRRRLEIWMPPMRCRLPLAVKSIIRKIVALTAKPAARLKLVAEQAYHGDK